MAVRNWKRCASHKGPGRSRGETICFSPPPPSSLAEDWAPAGVGRYRDDGNGLGDRGIWGYRGGGDGWSDGEHIFGRPRSRQLTSHLGSHLVSSCMFFLYHELYTPSFASCDPTRTFQVCMRICAIVWILTTGQHQTFSFASSTPRARTALAHEFRLQCRERCGRVLMMSSLPSSPTVSPQWMSRTV
jgi:hypothetical protein